MKTKLMYMFYNTNLDITSSLFPSEGSLSHFPCIFKITGPCKVPLEALLSCPSALLFSSFCFLGLTLLFGRLILSLSPSVEIKLIADETVRTKLHSAAFPLVGFNGSDDVKGSFLLLLPCLLDDS